jgi:hypothetical protein
MIQTPAPPYPAAPIPKERHGCLTAWLIMMIIANSVVSLIYVANLFGAGNTLNLSVWTLLILIILSLCGVLCAIFLFRWKKLGFWGYCVMAVLGVIVNLSIGLGIQSFSGLIGLALLYGVLQIGKQNKGWPQLE